MQYYYVSFIANLNVLCPYIYIIYLLYNSHLHILCIQIPYYIIFFSTLLFPVLPSATTESLCLCQYIHHQLLYCSAHHTQKSYTGMKQKPICPKNIFIDFTSFITRTYSKTLASDFLKVPFQALEIISLIQFFTKANTLGIIFFVYNYQGHYRAFSNDFCL